MNESYFLMYYIGIRVVYLIRPPQQWPMGDMTRLDYTIYRYNESKYDTVKVT